MERNNNLESLIYIPKDVQFGDFLYLRLFFWHGNITILFTGGRSSFVVGKLSSAGIVFGFLGLSSVFTRFLVGKLTLPM